MRSANFRSSQLGVLEDKKQKLATAWGALEWQALRVPPPPPQRSLCHCHNDRGEARANAHFSGKLQFPEGLLKGTGLGSRGAGARPQANSPSPCSPLAGAGRLTVLRHLQDVAEQRAVAVEGLGPRQVDGPSLCGAEGRHGVLGGVRQLPGGEIWWGHL